MVVTATADHRIELNGTTVTLDNLQTALHDALEKSTDGGVILQGDKSVVLEQAVQIMTIAKAAGAEKISIATAPIDAAKSH